MTSQVARGVQALLLAEKQIRLLDRVRPLGLGIELERLVSAWNSGSEPFPHLRYAVRPNLAKLREGLALFVEHSATFDDWGGWLAARAEELALEAEMVEAVGTPALGTLSAKRFPLPTGELGYRVEGLVAEWLLAEESTESSGLYRTDDSAEPNSLYSVLKARLEELKANARLRIERELYSVAATGDGSISILAGAKLTLLQAKRVAEHEIVAHLLPRQNASSATGILKCGCAHAAADEEGRALVIEERSALMDAARKRELALRHWACDASRQGADFVEVVRGLRQRDASIRTAVTTAMRCFRGSDGAANGRGRNANPTAPSGQGGLGRELVYLPAYLRLKRAFEAAPQLEQWFALGRASLEYARYMARSSSSQTGT